MGKISNRISNILYLGVIIAISSTIANSETWNGTALDNDWNNAANWDGGTVPGSSSNVLILDYSNSSFNGTDLTFNNPTGLPRVISIDDYDSNVDTFNFNISDTLLDHAFDFTQYSNAGKLTATIENVKLTNIDHLGLQNAAIDGATVINNIKNISGNFITRNFMFSSAVSNSAVSVIADGMNLTGITSSENLMNIIADSNSKNEFTLSNSTYLSNNLLYLDVWRNSYAAFNIINSKLISVEDPDVKMGTEIGITNSGSEGHFNITDSTLT